MGCILTKLYTEDSNLDKQLDELTLVINEEEKSVFEYTDWPFNGLVFEGGGINGIGYLGVYLALYKTNIFKNIIKVSASSIGTIFAIFIALNVDYIQVKKFIMQHDFSELKDDNIGIVRDLSNLINNYGWYKGEVMTNWIKEIFREHAGKESITFLELYKLYGVELNIIGSDLNIQDTIVYNKDTYPNEFVYNAINASMSIPIMYAPKKLIYKNDQGDEISDFIVDGGLSNNYDLDRFDKDGKANLNIIGFKIMDLLVEKRNDKIYYKRKDINSFVDYISSLLSFQSAVIERLQMKSIDKYWERTLTVPSLGLPLTDFYLDNETKIRANIISYNATIIQLTSWIKNKHFSEMKSYVYN